MNAMILGTEEGRILLDCGVTFAGMDPDLGVRPLGVSIIHPDFGALLAPRPGEPADVLRAIVITHGHEDHIGALPYLLRDLEMPLPPIYGPIYALELVKQRLGEMQVEAPAMHAIEVGKVFEAGPFTIEPYHVNHSIVDAMGLIFRTPAGTIVHSGDFKIEDVPADAPFPEDRLKALGDEGVALLMSDSTNVFAEGRSGDEATAAAALDALIAEQEQRVVIALFASNVHRMRSAFASASSCLFFSVPTPTPRSRITYRASSTAASGTGTRRARSDSCGSEPGAIGLTSQTLIAASIPRS